MYLDSIIDFINATVKTRMGSKAAHSRFYGICKIVSKDDDEKAVVMYDNAGNDVVIGDDSLHLECYHRFTGFSFQSSEQNQNNSFGRGTSNKSAFANFVMVVLGNRKSLEMTDQELTASLAFNFPDKLNQELVNQLTGVNNIVISPVSTENNPTGEPLNPYSENIFFSLKYRVAISGNVDCLSACYPTCV